jgi:hypothetical protein
VGFGGGDETAGWAPLHAAPASERAMTSRRCTGRHDTRLRLVQHPSNLKLGRDGQPPVDLGGSPAMRAVRGFRAFLRVHGRRLWWLHSAYALAIGVGVVTFAQRGFEHARWLAVSLGLAWLLVVLLFRLFGSGQARGFDAEDAKTRVRFYVMTYALKNLYQGMLFFLLPFYWKSATLDAPNIAFVLLLATCAVISALDLVFDRVLMRWRSLASVFHGVTLFGCLNLVIPALFPDTRTLWTLLAAAAIAVVSFWTLHGTRRQFRRKIYLAFFVISLCAGTGVAFAARSLVPPVPMYISSAAVGPKQLADGRLAMEVKALHPSVIQELIAVTDVVVPGGKGDRLRHVWRHENREVHRSSEETSRIEGPNGVVRLRSSLSGKDLPGDLVGAWRVDVETEDGQLVGRAEFEVVP